MNVVTDAIEDLQRRVAALEERLHMEAGLRAGGDRELGDIAQTLNAQRHTIQALAITQSQHTEVLRRVEEALQQQTAAFEALRTDHGAQLGQIVTLLTELIDRDERRGDGDQ